MMKQCNVILKDSKKMVSSEVRIADNFFSRLKGLMFAEKIEGYGGLLITRCNSIHTCFMKFNIDVVFLDKNQKVVKVIRELRPWRMTPMYFSASQVLELQGGTLSPEIQEGDSFEVVCLS